MTTHPRGPNVTRFLVRHYVEILTGVGVLFVLQTGLVPFDFADQTGDRGSTELFGTTISDFTFPDVVSNLFLYIPIGILFHWSFCRHVHNGVAALLLAIGATAALSGGVEFLQAYCGARFSSLIDFTCNVLGGLLGALISVRCRFIFPGFIRAVAREFQAHPQVALANVFACVLIGVAVMPFSFSLDAGMFKKSLKTVTVTPFGAVTSARTEAGNALAAEHPRQYAFAKWRELKCWSRWSVEFAAFAILAWLAQRALAREYGFSRPGTIALVWWLCGGLAVALSLLQLPLVTRAFDVTDILFRMLGIAGGLVLRSRYRGHVGTMSPRDLTRIHRKLAAVGCAATFSYIVYIGLIPLTIDLRGASPNRALASTDFLPFFAYFTTRFDIMMADVMEKFVSYAVFAALLTTAWTRVRRLNTTARMLVVPAIGVAVSIPLEIMQMYIPVRVPSLTDLILAWGGCVVGVLGQERAAMFYRLATSRDAVAPELRGHQPGTSPEFAPTDALVATLMDPHTDAPVERVPIHPPKPR